MALKLWQEKCLEEIHKAWTAAARVSTSTDATYSCIQDKGNKCAIPYVYLFINNSYFTWAKKKEIWTLAQLSRVQSCSNKGKFRVLFGNKGTKVWRK